MPRVAWRPFDEEGQRAYRGAMIRDVDELQRRLGSTDLLAPVLHWQRVGELRRKLSQIGPRLPHAQHLGELELTFLQNLGWVINRTGISGPTSGGVSYPRCFGRSRRR